MSAIMARESNCDPTARSATHDSGLLQINDINLTWLSTQMGTVVQGSTTVLIEGKPAAKTGSMCTVCAGLPGTLTGTAATVLIGG